MTYSVQYVKFAFVSKLYKKLKLAKVLPVACRLSLTYSIQYANIIVEAKIHNNAKVSPNAISSVWAATSRLTNV